MSDWLKMTACDLGREIGAGRIDPLELCEAYLAAAEAHPHRDEIYARLTPDRARAEAGAAAKRAGEGTRRGLLDGIPLSWKDLFDTAGVATEAGSALLQGRVPDRDADVLRRATEAGTVCLGKTHMSELAFSGLGLNPVTATPPCINDAEAVSGGSSSGGAASVAFGLAPCAIGSDTGGSVRLPAAWNDLVGLKTTSGRVSLDGVVPLCPRFDTVGPLCRSVEDAAQVLALLDGSAPADLGEGTLAGMRLGVVETVMMDDLRDAPARAFDEAVQRLERAGAEISRFEAPEVADVMAETGAVFAPEAYGIWGDLIEQAPDKMFAPILERFRSGRMVTAAEYVAAWRRIDASRARWAARVAGFDAVICPTCPITPPKRDRLLADEKYYVTENLMALRNTRLGNMMGLPAVTLPTGVPSCGIMLSGTPFGEERLLRTAAAAERALSAR